MPAAVWRAGRSSAASGGEWLSLHLFLRDAARPRDAGDGLLRGFVPDLLAEGRSAGLFGAAFFIRYGELGPHLRLRLDCADAPAGRLESFLTARLALGAASEDEAGAFFPSAHPAIERLRPIAYRPETERYGGESALPAAEDFFAASSELVLGLLRAAGPEAALADDRRQALALIAMAVTLRALAGDDRVHAARLALAYRDEVMQVIGSGLLPSRDESLERFERGTERQAASLGATVDDFWQALADGPAELPPPFAGFAARMLVLRERLDGLLAAGLLRASGAAATSRTQALAWLTPSYLHMTNNRAGINLLEECYLGHLLGRLLAPAETAVLP